MNTTSSGESSAQSITRNHSPINIPSSQRTEGHDYLVYQPTSSSLNNVFSSSPGPIEHSAPHRKRSIKKGETWSAQLRHPLANQNTSPPHSPHHAPSPSPHIPSASVGISTSRTHPERQWSLFGQMMENEGQLPNPDVLPWSRRRTSSVQPQHEQHTLIDGTLSGGIGRETQGHPQTPGDSVDDLEDFSSDTISARTRIQDEYDSDDSDTSVASASTVPLLSTNNAPASRLPSWFPRRPHLTIIHRNILKCSIAYFVASLFTFCPTLSHMVSDLTSYGPGTHKPSPSGHMVATIAVYFNPAKTMGAMIEADLFCLLGLFYSSFVCLASMSMFWWLELQPGWEWLGDAVAILWIGISMTFVAWMKVWMASPSFNTACSMTAIIIFVVLVKEGGLQTLLQVSTIILCGSFISNLICYLIWPQTAASNLQINMTKSLESFSTLLSMLTNVFLLENETELPTTRLEKVQKAVENHQGTFMTLKKDLSEARSEYILFSGGSVDRDISGLENAPGLFKDYSSEIRAYEDAVDSLNRLAQHLNGLRSGTRLQYELTKAGVIRGRNFHKGAKGKSLDIAVVIPEDEETAMLQAAAQMFGDLVDELGPPLKALSTVCTSTLCRLREAFVESKSRKRRERNDIQPHEFKELIEGIERALVRFESTSNHAVLRLYRRSDFISQSRSASATSLDGDNDEKVQNILTGGDHEHVFLVYFFIFTLQEFAAELLSLVNAIQRIYLLEEQNRSKIPIWTKINMWFRKRGWGIKQWWKPGRVRAKQAGLKRTLSAYMIPDHRIPHPFFPKIRPHAPDTIQTPPRSQLTLMGKLKQTLWTIGKRLKERDTKYAIKAGMATAMLAAPAFFDATRPTFVNFWGDWALISFFVVISPTIGATNYLSLQRVLGTLFGAAVAAGIYSLFPENAIVLSIFGFLFSIPCFYFAVAKPQYLSASRFVLLTYNLTCLYCYNARDRDVSVINVAFHRALAVTAGVLWAAVVSRFWWPSEARRELTKALGEFCLNIGWLYTRLVASNSFAPEYQNEVPTGDGLESERDSFILRRAQTTRLNNSIQEFMAMELHLQIKLIELQGLLAQTQHEPRLKGPFPVQLYRGVLTSLQTILDKLHSMRCVTTREEWYTSVRQDFILPVNRERREMVGNIILGFSTLASAFRLKAPLPPYLPPAEKSRQRLVEAIRKLDVVKNREVKGSRQLLFFAYALTMKGVTQELESLGRTLQDAFGVIGQTSEEFEALFMQSAAYC